MTKYASGRWSVAACDRCGRKIDYVDLMRQIYARKWTGLLVCSDCLDQDHPQLFLPRKLDDPQALRNARPILDDDGTTVPMPSTYPFPPDPPFTA